MVERHEVRARAIELAIQIETPRQSFNGMYGGVAKLDPDTVLATADKVLAFMLKPAKRQTAQGGTVD